MHTPTRRVLGLDGEFVLLRDGTRNSSGNLRGIPRVGHLAIVTVDDNGSRNVLFNKIIRPRMTEGRQLTFVHQGLGLLRRTSTMAFLMMMQFVKLKQCCGMPLW